MRKRDRQGQRNFIPDDPWDIQSDLSSPHRTETIASGSSGADPVPQRKALHRTETAALVIVIVAAVILILAAASLWTGNRVGGSRSSDGADSTQVNDLPEGDGFSGDDGFSVDVDPDNEGGQDVSDEEETGPSQMDRYAGSTDFSLELHTRDGLDPLSYSEIYAKVSPSVVTVTVYGDFSGAYATGIILTEDGYILTNQHVVANQIGSVVTTEDDISYDALLVGEDANSDLAVLKIEAEGLTPAEFGDSAELVVGDECFAIGNPLGISYRSSFSNGIVSALNRSVSVNGYSMTLIQTTAALNSGNSGGPLINCYGQVIGVNNMKIMSSSTTVEGLGFAVPSATVQRVVNTLLTDGYVEHPVIGITCYSVTAEDQYGNEISGIYVASVSSGSDAGEQGLSVGDIITAFNGEMIRQAGDIDLSGMHVGDEVSVTVYRDGDVFDIAFRLVEQDELDS